MVLCECVLTNRSSGVAQDHQTFRRCAFVFETRLRRIRKRTDQPNRSLPRTGRVVGFLQILS